MEEVIFQDFVLMKIIKLYIINGEVKRVKKLEMMLCCVILGMNLGGCKKTISRGEEQTKELGSEQQMR